jgi:hypothetical protein
MNIGLAGKRAPAKTWEARGAKGEYSYNDYSSKKDSDGSEALVTRLISNDSINHCYTEHASPKATRNNHHPTFRQS